jgi:hypothetical protein
MAQRIRLIVRRHWDGYSLPKSMICWRKRRSGKAARVMRTPLGDSHQRWA